MKKVELLSPAGGYETMVGAFNAGADAVYLGGSKFGARAYADNFDRDQVLDAIVYAHLHGKRIYMTVNTLIKESEFGELYDFMLPYAEKNLDGVIVQDFGVMRLIGKEFPNIELHASTQQTVTGVYGAKLLKDLGCCRVVPARELSLSEMKAIRQEADVEVEAFIHGAMCYCYSGACLFSSVIGGRSGNRGRCAQPCRLPYNLERGDGKELYPLSLKDMSTIGIIPELIEAGIDSFKIEGRMKKPEYSAGVTALYRKYIDRYYADPKGDHRVSKEDMEILRSLYQRTGISEGYYHRHNDKAMVTLSSPAYNATSDKILADVHEKYLTSELKLKCDIYCELKAGENARLTMTAYKGGDVFYAEEYGNEVQAASKRPMEEADVRKQLCKMGGTPFEVEMIEVSIDDGGSGSGIFIAVSELNELRRRLVASMLQQMESGAVPESAEAFGGADSQPCTDAENHVSFTDYSYYSCKRDEDKNNNPSVGNLHILVSTGKQLEVALKEAAAPDSPVRRIYMDSNVFLSPDDHRASAISEAHGSCPDLQLFVALPYVTRSEEWDGIREIDRIIKKADELNSSFTDDAADTNPLIRGLLVRNLEQLGYLREVRYTGQVILDYSIYTWNREAALEFLDCNVPSEGFMISEMTIPYELSFGEAKDLLKSLKDIVDIPVSYNIYGHLPMMISAGCVKKTTDKCSGKLHELHTESLHIVDRMNNTLPVTANCRSCYNIIWNAHPTSLHKRLDKVLSEKRIHGLRLDFSVESPGRMIEVLSFYKDKLRGADAADIFADKNFTGGHFNRGVE